MARRYFIPQSSLGDPEFIAELMTGLHSMLIHHGAAFDLKNVAPPRAGVRYWWYAESRGRGAIVVTDDGQMPPLGRPVRYLSVEGSDEFVRECGGWVEKYVPFIPVPELQRAVREHREDEPTFLVVLAMAAGEEPDPTSVELILDALNAEDDAVRYTAVFVGSLVSWKQLDEPLRDREQHDASPDVRKLAANVLAAREAQDGAAGG
ncbi:MAG: HEAT repeat domain-containing protein [Polyangiaceae bacterium]